MSAKKKSRGNKVRRKQKTKRGHSVVANKRKDKRIKRRKRASKKRPNAGHAKRKTDRRVLSKRKVSPTRKSSATKNKKKKAKPKKISESRLIEATYKNLLLRVCSKLSEPCTVDSDVEWHIRHDEYERVNSLLYVKGNDIYSLLDELSIVQHLKLSARNKPWIQIAFGGQPKDKNYNPDGKRSFSNFATKNYAMLRATILHGGVWENIQKYMVVELMKVRLHWNIDDEQPEEFG